MVPDPGGSVRQAAKAPASTANPCALGLLLPKRLLPEDRFRSRRCLRLLAAAKRAFLLTCSGKPPAGTFKACSSQSEHF
jgi:hypothetical protein